ncbi:MAG: LysR family transcriptional regulator [Cardiobacteriaceae bacterium]|nr:LysR family transcriptional regulator [Cardiobacteriaceae bacterium]
MHNNDTITPPARDLFDGIAVFLSVARHKSFRAAADELGLSPSAVGQTIRNLEARLGTTLLARTTRRVGLTEAGERFLPQAEEAARLMMSARDTLHDFAGAASGTLRLTMPRVVAGLIAPLLAEHFLPRHPGLALDLDASDRLVDLIAENRDAALRLDDSLEKDMVAVRVSPPFPFVIVASPAYLAAHGTPAEPEDLARHDCLNMRLGDGQGCYRWEFVRGTRRFSMAVPGHIVINDIALGITLARHGAGLLYIARPLVAEALARGELVGVLDDFLPESDGLFLCYPSRRQALPKVQAFSAFVREFLAPGLAGERAGWEIFS